MYVFWAFEGKTSLKGRGRKLFTALPFSGYISLKINYLHLLKETAEVHK